VLTTSISFVVPFVAYLPAERLGASGVLAAVVAGLVTGARGRSRFEAGQRLNDHTNWRTVQFVLEHAVFLVMGLEFRPLVRALGAGSTFMTAAGLGVLLVAVLFLVRAVYVAAELPVLRSRERRLLSKQHDLEERARQLDAADAQDDREAARMDRAERAVARKRADLLFLRENGLSWRGATVVGWSGMRGVVTLAAAQSLPERFPQRPLLVLIAFTVSVVTLLGFGGTLPFVIRSVRIRGAGRRERREEVRELLDHVRQASIALLDDPQRTKVGDQPADPRVLELLRERYGVSPSDVEQSDDDDDGTRSDLHDQLIVLRRRMRQAARDELLDARAVGTYSTRAITTAQDVLDLADAREDRITDPI
jgi:CPA1 family monovalent cation:H+ antiporter